MRKRESIKIYQNCVKDLEAEIEKTSEKCFKIYQLIISLNKIIQDDQSKLKSKKL